MKRLLFTLMILIGTGFYLSAQAQPQITNFGDDGDSCFVNNPTSYQSVVVWGNFNNATPGMTVTIHWGDATNSSANVTTQTTNGWFNGAHTYSLPGTYTVMAVLFDAGSNPVDSSIITVDAFCYTLYGILYKRNDANCTYDVGVDDPIATFQEIEVRKNNVPIDTFATMGWFHYRIPNPDLTSEFSLHPLNSSNGYVQVCPAPPAIHKIRLDTLTNSNNNFNYGYNCNAATGFDLFVYASGFLRFVNNSYISIHAGNAFCTPKNGVVTLNIDPQYSYQSAAPAPTSVSGQTVTWNVNNLSGSNSEYIYVTLSAVDTLTPGDTACNVVTITPTSGDINAANNTYNYCDIIHASMDPNDKKVSPLSDIAAGQELTYTINFENMGDDIAFNIHVVDTLSANLDLSTFKLVSSSHAVNTNFYNYGSTKIARFDFNNIQLADKNHPESNKGFIIYKVRAKANLAPGTEITNTAHIYFDINPAVVTNTVRSKIPNPNSIGRVEKEDGITVYPNPADNVLFIDSKTDRFSKALLVNALGQVIAEQGIRKGTNSIETSGLSSGIYYLILNGNEGTRSVKITKK